MSLTRWLGRFSFSKGGIGDFFGGYYPLGLWFTWVQSQKFVNFTQKPRWPVSVFLSRQISTDQQSHVFFGLHCYSCSCIIRYVHIIYLYTLVYIIYISMYSTTLYVDNDNDGNNDNNNNRNNKSNNHVLLLLQGILNNILWYDMIEYNMTCYCMIWQMTNGCYETHTDIAFTVPFTTTPSSVAEDTSASWSWWAMKVHRGRLRYQERLAQRYLWIQ